MAKVIDLTSARKSPLYDELRKLDLIWQQLQAEGKADTAQAVLSRMHELARGASGRDVRS